MKISAFRFLQVSLFVSSANTLKETTGLHKLIVLGFGLNSNFTLQNVTCQSYLKRWTYG